ncbi:hypothetical protein GCM10010912_55220 [Paenibacillus albidus]|uniref:Uncharacterized protein n=1 Tax=Paenibacillus albidus TaxID=2041023 RepID=A0A917CZD6_9BACL|nr:hypothetical protein GCM10010912_55220 [Paenibacillus albidus]
MPIFRKFGKRLFILVLAMVFSAIGVSLFIECNIGSDTLTVLLDGLHKSFGISLGLTSFLLNIIFLLYRRQLRNCRCHFNRQIG